MISVDSWKAILSRAWKKGDILQKAICLLFIKMGFSNQELQVLEIRNKNYQYLRKKYQPILDAINYERGDYSDDGIEHIWICWFQGWDSAPELIKKCIKSVYRHMPEKTIHLITQNNIHDYVQLPDYILDKWKKGIISYAHLSDLLRTELLIKYGGMWIDATVYLTNVVPDYVYKKPLFLFHYKVREDMTISNNSWFIFAKKNNRTLKVLRELLYVYWKKENKVREYFLWHLFLKMVFEKYPEDYHDIYYVSDEMAHMMKYNIFEKFDSTYYEMLKRFSTVHKLTYKLTIPPNIKGTYYEYLLSNQLENL